jgi:hypothetical protein
LRHGATYLGLHVGWRQTMQLQATCADISHRDEGRGANMRSKYLCFCLVFP